MEHTLHAAPVSQGERLASIDVLRGFALLGILAMNVMVFAMPMAAYSNPTIFTEYSGTNRATYWVVHTLFDLKMMGLFSMLFGAGVVVWSRKAETPEDARRLRWLWLRRMCWLLVFGVIHGWLIWEGDILYSYALCGLMVVWWLRRLPPVWLFVVSGAFFAVHLLLAGFQGFQVWMLFSDSAAAASIRAEAPPEAIAAGLEALQSYMAPTPEQVQAEVAALRGDWATVFRHRAGVTLMMEIQGFLFYIFWRAASMMLLGIALTKTGVFTGKRSAAFYGRMAAIGYAIGVPLIVGGIVFNESHGFGVVWFALAGTFFNLIGAVPMMLGHAGLLLWIVKKGYLARLTGALARVGQMAFTNYLMQSVLCSLIFYGWGLGMAGEVGRLGQELIVVGIWVVEILWSVAWLSRYRFGPAEWLWRSLTYWELQPMRRA
ncbi:MAG: DUF418 domain-containing protein [Phycisphaerales bacterium]|nr:DUF418 domain-containing protein [Phycisphaerales bacterium]